MKGKLDYFHGQSSCSAPTMVSDSVLKENGRTGSDEAFKIFYIVLTPLLLLMCVFIVIPIISSIAISFIDYNLLQAEGNSFV